MKKIVVTILCILCLTACPISYAEAATEANTNAGTAQLIKLKDKTEKKLEDYKQEYGSDAYGMAAYVLNIVRLYSIPCCFIGIAVGAIYQYVIGIRKLDVRDKGFNMIIAFVTILVIAQILPLIFAIVVKGWRG